MKAFIITDANGKILNYAISNLESNNNIPIIISVISQNKGELTFEVELPTALNIQSSTPFQQALSQLSKFRIETIKKIDANFRIGKLVSSSPPNT